MLRYPAMNASRSPSPFDSRVVGTRHRRQVILGLALTAFALSGCSGLSEDDRVSLDQARADVEAGRALLVDLREPAEQASGVVPGALLLPSSQLRRRLGEIPVDAQRPVYLICATQSRSRSVLKALRERGYAHVRYVHGGMRGWAGRGWPRVRPGG